MSKTSNTLWPQLLIEGGWRTIKQPGEYWPLYMRRRGSKKQCIAKNKDNTLWCLWHVTKAGKVIPICAEGNLDFCLTQAGR